MTNHQQIQIATQNIVQMLDDLPILSTIIGTRSDDHEAGPSTPEEQKLMEALQAVYATWVSEKPQ